jgi:putative restriction endonuclease
MIGYIGNTDFDWYRCLSGQGELEEVNFWQPSGGRAFRVVGPGAPFFFKLKKPHNAICGFGFFAGHSVLPAWLAWDSFGVANGAPTFTDMRSRIEKYRKADLSDPHAEYLIGCLMIAEPVFFPEDLWIPQPSDWKPNIVQGSSYDLTTGEGARLWDQCRERSAGMIYGERWGDGTDSGLDLPSLGDGATLPPPRVGQGIFRIQIIDAYDRACSVTREHSLPVLEAAHITPYAETKDHSITNGILLRSDLHKLFDRGYATVTPDYRFHVSPRLKEDFDNGAIYYEMDGRSIALPGTPMQRPDPQ